MFCLLCWEKRKTWLTSLVTWITRESVWLSWRYMGWTKTGAGGREEGTVLPSSRSSFLDSLSGSSAYLLFLLHLYGCSHPSPIQSVSSNSMWSLSQGLSRASWHPANGHCFSISWLKATGNSLSIWTRILKSFISGILLWPIFGSAVTSRIRNRDICFKVCLYAKNIFFFHKLFILYWSISNL